MSTPKILIPFYSRSGTVARLAEAVAEGARAEGAEVRLRRAREVVPDAVIASVSGWKEGADALNAQYEAPTADDAVWADGIIFGTPTRFGSVSSELKSYIDGLGGLWATGALVGKAGAVFAASSQPHGGSEVTTLSLYPVLAHLGLIIVPTGYADGVMFAGAGSPYGASVISGHPPAGPSEAELAVARFQGKRVAQVAKKLTAA